MKIVKQVGIRKVFIMEDGSEVSFAEYANKNNKGSKEHKGTDKKLKSDQKDSSEERGAN